MKEKTGWSISFFTKILIPIFILIAVNLSLTSCQQKGPASATGDFFRPAPDDATKYPADKIYPQGRIFPFSGFAGDPEKYKEKSFTMAGPSVRTLPQLAAIKAHGLKAIMDLGFSREELAKAASVDELVKKIRVAVKSVMDDETIAWWYINPEEMKSWSRKEMEYLEKAANAIRATDPLKRPVWMYDPNHRSASALEPIARHLDIVGKGMYVNYAGMRESRIWCRWTIEQEKEAIARAKPSAIPIAVPEMFQQPADEYLPLIPAWVRHDAYLALVSGAKGMVVFSLWARSGFPAYPDYYAAYSRVAEEVCGEMNLGQVFLFGERRDDLSVAVVEGPKTVSMVFPSGGVKEPIEYPSVSHANIAWGKQRYLFLVNSANVPVSVMVGLYPCENTYVREIFGKEKPSLLPKGDFKVYLPPLGVKCYIAALGKE